MIKLLMLFCTLPVAVQSDTATAIIVTAGVKDAANVVAKAQFDPVGGENTFTAPLVSLGATNIVAYWCADRMAATNRAKLPAFTNVPPFTDGAVIFADYDPDTDPTAPFRMLKTNGLAVYAPPLN